MPEQLKNKRIGLGDKFVHKYGSQDELFDYGLNPKTLLKKFEINMKSNLIINQKIMNFKSRL